MKCKLCYKYFERGTTNSPAPNNICNKCFNTYFTIEEVPISKEQEIQHCLDVIKICTDNITKYRKTLDGEIQEMKYWCEKLNELTESESGGE